MTFILINCSFCCYYSYKNNIRWHLSPLRPHSLLQPLHVDLKSAHTPDAAGGVNQHRWAQRQQARRDRTVNEVIRVNVTKPKDLNLLGSYRPRQNKYFVKVTQLVKMCSRNIYRQARWWPQSFNWRSNICRLAREQIVGVLVETQWCPVLTSSFGQTGATWFLSAELFIEEMSGLEGIFSVAAAQDGARQA